jgi:hypothetical protein
MSVDLHTEPSAENFERISTKLKEIAKDSGIAEKEFNDLEKELKELTAAGTSTEKTTEGLDRILKNFKNGIMHADNAVD